MYNIADLAPDSHKITKIIYKNKFKCDKKDDLKFKLNNNNNNNKL